MKCCVLIPTLNESKTIGGLVSDILNKGYDVTVIDDGSSDNTADIAKDNGAHVIRHKQNKGKGASLRDGFDHALNSGYDAVIIVDGDGQHNPEDIPRFISEAQSNGADIVIGNRMDSSRSMPVLRRITNLCLSRFISNTCGQEIPDTQCGFRLIKTDLFRSLHLTTSKFETESEILIKAGKYNFKILSIPIKSIYKGELSTINPIKDAFRFVRLILTIKFKKKLIND